LQLLGRTIKAKAVSAKEVSIHVNGWRTREAKICGKWDRLRFLEALEPCR